MFVLNIENKNASAFTDNALVAVFHGLMKTLNQGRTATNTLAFG